MSKCEHQWGSWGHPKPNDHGHVLSYRRCQVCDTLEERDEDESFSVHFDTSSKLGWVKLTGDWLKYDKP